MRRTAVGLSVALLTFWVGSMIAGENRGHRVVRSGSGFGVSSYDGLRVTGGHDIFPSPSGAVEHFNEQLQKSAHYTEYSPCFDSQGRRVGERALTLIQPPSSSAATWRIMWTQQSEDFSESFWVESDSLVDARRFETDERQGWKKCLPRN